MATSLPPGPSCPIGWQPSALAPVFYGYRDYTAADGAPLTVRVYFPSLDGSPDSAGQRFSQLSYGGNVGGLKILYAVVGQ